MALLSGRIDETETKRVKIDKKDKKILALLSEDSRQSLASIAKKVKLSRDSVDYRIKRMLKEGVILGFVPIVPLKKFGYFRFHVFMLLEEKDKEKQKQLFLELKRHPNIGSVMEYSGRWDAEMDIIAKNLKEFDDILSGLISRHQGVILDKDELEIIKNFKAIQLPHKFYEESDIRKYERTPLGEADLDDKDIRILSILSSNARLSTYKIAEKIGLSPDAVSYRIKGLLEKKVIKKFSVVLNLSKLGLHWYTFAMKLDVLGKNNESKFNEFVSRHPCIIHAVKTLGDWDILVYIVADSAHAFHNTVKEIKTQFADIIKHYETWVAFKEHTINPFPQCLRKTSKLKKVLAFGTFDMLHPGHISLFKEAKKLGDHLTVVVARDKTVEEIKKKPPKINEAERLEHVSELSVVDEAILGSQGDKYQILEEVNPDIICLGYDQLSFTQDLEKELEKRGIKAKIVRLKPYKEEKYKSSKLNED